MLDQKHRPTRIPTLRWILQKVQAIHLVSTALTQQVSNLAVMISGTPKASIGSYTLRHVNNVPGATAEQRQWHLQSANIAQVN